MLSDIFYWVLNASILGSVTGVIILLLRKIRNLPRFAVYFLWLLPLIRLWVQFGIASRYSWLNLISKFATKTVVIWETVPDITMTNSIGAANRYFPIEYKTNILETTFHVASIVWIIIMAAAILTIAVLYILTKLELKTAEKLKDNIYMSDKITGIAVYGIFNPKIIIPASLAKCDINYIILHEQVHIKRRDNLWRAVAVITACVHWFNPLIWIFLKYFFTDMELACDAKVVKYLDEPEKKEYAEAILSVASGKVFFASAFGGAKTRVRIENILSYKQLTLFSGICTTLLVIAVAIVLITNAAK